VGFFTSAVGVFSATHSITFVLERANTTLVGDAAADSHRMSTACSDNKPNICTKQGNDMNQEVQTNVRVSTNAGEMG
jgi:hypothetical protein